MFNILARNASLTTLTMVVLASCGGEPLLHEVDGGAGGQDMGSGGTGGTGGVGGEAGAGGGGGSGGQGGTGGAGGSGGEEEVGDPAFVAFRFDHPERYGAIQFFTRGGQEVEPFDGLDSECEGSDDVYVLHLPSGVRHLEIHSDRGLRWRGDWLVETDTCREYELGIGDSYTFISGFGVGGRLVPWQIFDESGAHITTLRKRFSMAMLNQLGLSNDEVRIGLLDFQESGHVFLSMINEDTYYTFSGVGKQDSIGWFTWYPVLWGEWAVEIVEVE